MAINRVLRLIVAAWMIGQSSASALTFTVDDTADATDVETGDGRCETPSETCSLRAALQEANATEGPDEIVLPPGVYSLILFDLEEDVAQSGDLDVTDDLTLRGASAATTIVNGGRIDRVFQIDPAATRGVTVEVSDIAIQGGSAGSGGALANQGTLVLRGVAITDNTGLTNGGAIFNDGTLTVEDSVISGNVSRARGGGVFNQGELTMINTTVSGNRADGSGGGIDNEGMVTVTTCTVADNEATKGGGGIANRGVALASGSIVAGNRADNCDGTATSSGYNLDDDGTCGFAGPTDRPDIDPQLCPLGDFGGTTFTHAIPADSPAIDAGPSAGCPDMDQRGVTRPRDGDGDGTPVCDIGAFEAADSASSCAPVPPTPTRTPTRTAPTPTAIQATCPGDCDGNESVAVNELVRGVRIVLGTSAVVDCPAFDRNDSDTVTIEELVAAVRALLDGCTL